MHVLSEPRDALSSARENPFEAQVAHEIRSSLSLLEARLDTALLRPRSAAYYEETLREVRQYAADTRALFGALMDLSRLESIHELPFEVSCDLATVVSGLELSKKDFWRLRNIVFRQELASAWVLGERVLLAQVATNLLDNAAKYSPPHAEIELRTATNRSFALLEVVDRGMGMTEDEIRHCQEPFWRSGEAAAQASGHGLGLALVRRIVTLHRGELQIVSKKGHGTTVRAIFPTFTVD